MNRDEADEILIDRIERRKREKRKRKILYYIYTIIIITIICLSLICTYINKNKGGNIVKYEEKSNIDYNVYLKENEFFNNDYLEKDNQYISSLIDYIDANFKYELSLLEEKDINYNYSYRIEAEVNVKDKTTKNSLYNYKEELVPKVEKTANSSLEINEKVKIDYNHFNDYIKKFVHVYELDNANSTLDINLYISVIGSCEDFESDSNNESVITLSIPLTTETMAIDITSNLENEDNNVILCKTTKSNPAQIIFGIIAAIIDVLLIVRLIKYIIKTRTAETIYQKELKKILNNYRSYIQKIDNEFSFDGYQILNVDTFTAMLEIRDTIQEPILMIENQNKTATHFIIPSKTKIIYVYVLQIHDSVKLLSSGNTESDPMLVGGKDE